jgi:transposase InsO family protein
MDLAGYVVRAVVVEGRSVAEVVADHGVSRSWLYELLARYRQAGDEGLRPGSKRPHTSPTAVPARLEEEIVALRKALTDEGLDAGAATIQWHLSRRRRRKVPSVSTIWRVLARRGFVTPQPHKRPRSSYVRFEAELPNECWQADATHWTLADGTWVEILNVVDDYSRLCVASVAFRTIKAADVATTFFQAAERWGLPASLLTDNGAVFTAAPRGGTCLMETELGRLGIAYKHPRPYHPQTCGKVERFHQTLKRHLTKQPKAATVRELQRQLDRFVRTYNTERPHRARGRRTPASAFENRSKATPPGGVVVPSAQHRVRQDRIDRQGRVTLRHRSKLRHIAVGRAHAGTRVLLLVADVDVRVLTFDGELLRQLTLDPSKNYQALGRT